MEYFYTLRDESFDIEDSSFDTLYEDLADMCLDDVAESIEDIPSRSLPCGFGIPYEKLEETKDVLRKRYSGEIIRVFHISNNENPVATYSLADIYMRYFEEREDCEVGYVDGAQLALDMMSNFLNEGKWHFGLIDAEGNILKDPNSWPQYPMKEDGSIVWKVGEQTYKPIIWFGLDDEKPIECWTLYERDNIADTKVYLGEFGKEINQEDWKSFWFNEFRGMDWNVLWNDGSAIIWAFSECGMEEPEDEFEKVKARCPIELSQADSTEEMLLKVRKYCYHMQKVS